MTSYEAERPASAARGFLRVGCMPLLDEAATRRKSIWQIDMRL